MYMYKYKMHDPKTLAPRTGDAENRSSEQVAPIPVGTARKHIEGAGSELIDGGDSGFKRIRTDVEDHSTDTAKSVVSKEHASEPLPQPTGVKRNVGCGASKGATTTSTAGTLSTMTGAFDPSDGML